ncbi:MAG: threonine/serine dehydratase [Pseudomonadota bacterium]
MADNGSVSIDDVRAAQRRIADHIVRTPLLQADALDERAGGAVFCKAECLQGTGSFKLRGAMNHVLSLREDQKPGGVVAYSSGNHAQGVARAAKRAGVPAAIVMPSDAPLAKRQRTARDGAEVILYDRVRESREEIGARLAEERGAVLIPPFDHPLTVAGQGTAGLEIVEDMAQPIDQLVICGGGGGLAAGITLAVRDQHPHAEIYVVEPEGFDDTGRSLASGSIQRNDQLTGSICDALLSPTPGVLPFAILSDAGARGVTVSDDEALSAMAFAMHELKVVLEPGGAVALAAVLSGKVETRGKVTVLTLSGGNADNAMINRALSL